MPYNDSNRLVGNTQLQTFVLNCTDRGRTFSLGTLEYDSCNFLSNGVRPIPIVSCEWILVSVKLMERDFVDRVDQHLHRIYSTY